MGVPRSNQDASLSGCSSFSPSNDEVLRMRAQSVHRKRQLLRFVQGVQESLLDESGVKQSILDNAALFLRPSEYVVVVEERTNESVCGFPLCRKKVHVKRNAAQNREVDAGDKMRFCSKSCLCQSEQFRVALSDDPIEFRSNIPLKLAHSTGVVERVTSQTSESSESQTAQLSTLPQSTPVPTTATTTQNDQMLLEEELFLQRERCRVNSESSFNESSTQPEQILQDVQSTSEIDDDDSDSDMKHALRMMFDEVPDAHEMAISLKSSLSPFCRLLHLIMEWTKQSDTDIFLSELHLDPDLDLFNTHTCTSYPSSDDTDEDASAQRHHNSKCDALMHRLSQQIGWMLSLLSLHNIDQLRCLIDRALPKLVYSFRINDAVPSLRLADWRFLLLVFINVLLRACRWHISSDSCRRALFNGVSAMSTCRLVDLVGYKVDHLHVLIDTIYPQT